MSEHQQALDIASYDFVHKLALLIVKESEDKTLSIDEVGEGIQNDLDHLEREIKDQYSVY